MVERVVRIAFQRSFTHIFDTICKQLIISFQKFQDGEVVLLDIEKIINFKEEADKVTLILKSAFCAECVNGMDIENVVDVIKTATKELQRIVMSCFAVLFKAEGGEGILQISEEVSATLASEVYCVLVRKPKKGDMH